MLLNQNLLSALGNWHLPKPGLERSSFKTKTPTAPSMPVGYEPIIAKSRDATRPRMAKLFLEEEEIMTTNRPSRRSFLQMATKGAAGALAFSMMPASAFLAQPALAQMAAGSDASAFKEAPMLAARVAEGTLPPVGERLPVNPKVLTVEAVGNYGGALRQQTSRQGGHFFLDGAQLIFPQHTNNDGNIIELDLCSKVELSPDAREITLTFREGLKWSDGTPLGADDIMFWWESEQNNKELFPNGPLSNWVIDGEPALITKVDDQTVRVTMPKPYRPLLNMSAHERMSPGANFGQPIAYMSRYHIDHNPDANAVAKEDGFDVWHQAYLAKIRHLGPYANKPHVGPWVKVETGSTREVFERNPYFHQVDTEGNQLPYIDRIVLDIVPDVTLRSTRTVAGEQSQGDIVLSQMDVARGNQDNAGYTILGYKNSNPSQCCLAFNLNHKDPVLREIYNDRRFRMAMSHAINRDEMNEILYFGLGTPGQATINPKASYFKDEWLTKYADFDVDGANALLDEMGLQWDAERKWRLRPDGQPLRSTYAFYPEFTVEHLELVRSYWEKVGHDLIIQEVARELRDERGRAADHDITGWNIDLAEEIACYLPYATKFQPNLEMYYGVDWWRWVETAGAEGEEPPQAWKDQFARMADWYAAASDDEYARLASEVWQFFSDEVPIIGTVGYVPMPTASKNGLMNVPVEAQKGYGTLHAQTFFVQGYFWSDPAAHA
jgi:peptide/nickel transport system substrate-binding protein